MEKIWFILSEGEVSGPYTTDDINRNVQVGRWDRDTLIWWKGHGDWTKISMWQNDLPHILDSLATSNQEPQWYLYYDGKQSGPMGRATLISTMRTITQLKDARVWNAALADWKSAFDVPELLMDLGVLTRNYVRAEIVGEVEIQCINGKQFKYMLSTISEGGFGVHSAPDLRLGERVQFTIRSPLLVSHIRAIGRVVTQQGPQAQAGFSFEALNMDAKSIILDYVRQQRGTLSNEEGAAQRAVFNQHETPSEDTNGGKKEVATAAPAPVVGNWYINRAGVEQGPMLKEDLLIILSQLEDKSMVRISNDNKEWRGPFDFEEVVVALGISRRQYHRAPIVGQLVIQSEDRRYFFEVVSISERGAGVRGDMPHSHGQSFQAILSCPVLKTTMEVEVECIQTPARRVCGIKFVSFEKHHRAEIKTYVAMFAAPGETGTLRPSAA